MNADLGDLSEVMDDQSQMNGGYVNKAISNRALHGKPPSIPGRPPRQIQTKEGTRVKNEVDKSKAILERQIALEEKRKQISLEAAMGSGQNMSLSPKR